MICDLTYKPFAFEDRTLIVSTAQKADLQRIAASAGVRVHWLTGATEIREYSDTEEPDLSSFSSWILVVGTVEEAGVLQAALDLE